MAMRRDPRQGQETPPREEQQESGVVEFPKMSSGRGIRPETMAIFDRIIAEDRSLFDRLAAYDSGEGKDSGAEY